MEFLIWVPEYRHTSCGISVLHRLCHLLNENGYKAFVNTSVTNPEWNTPTKTFASDDTVVIYPEIVHGNPFGAKRIIRWVLNDPGKIGGPLQYGPEEYVLYWPWFPHTTKAAAIHQNITEENQDFMEHNAKLPYYEGYVPFTYVDKTMIGNRYYHTNFDINQIDFATMQMNIHQILEKLNSFNRR
jgi:hypothetical protein